MVPGNALVSHGLVPAASVHTPKHPQTPFLSQDSPTQAEQGTAWFPQSRIQHQRACHARYYRAAFMTWALNHAALVLLVDFGSDGLQEL